jgi:hypothetical protein
MAGGEEGLVKSHQVTTPSIQSLRTRTIVAKALEGVTE